MANSFTYTARESAEAGLMFYRARQYSPAIGRFTSEDPIRFEAGMNFYIYANINPVNFFDPFGKSAAGASGGGKCNLEVHCRAVKDDRNLFGIAKHCYIIMTDSSGNKKQVSGGPRDPDNDKSGAWVAEIVIEKYWLDPCLNCHKTTEVNCVKIDCIEKKTNDYHNKGHGYSARGKTKPNSNSFIEWVMTVCGMPIPPEQWPWGAKGCDYWTGGSGN